MFHNLKVPGSVPSMVGVWTSVSNKRFQCPLGDLWSNTLDCKWWSMLFQLNLFLSTVCDWTCDKQHNIQVLRLRCHYFNQPTIGWALKHYYANCNSCVHYKLCTWMFFTLDATWIDLTVYFQNVISYLYQVNSPSLRRWEVFSSPTIYPLTADILYHLGKAEKLNDRMCVIWNGASK